MSTLLASWLSTPTSQLRALFVAAPLLFLVLVVPALEVQAYEQKGCR